MLRRVLGVSFGVAVLVGNTILIGILRTPGDVAAQLPSPALFIGVWVIGGIFALLGAISLAEPGAMLARSGGQYVIVRPGMGPRHPGMHRATLLRPLPFETYRNRLLRYFGTKGAKLNPPAAACPALNRSHNAYSSEL